MGKGRRSSVATAAVRTAMSFAPSCAARGGAPSPEREGGKGDGGQYCMHDCMVEYGALKAGERGRAGREVNASLIASVHCFAQRGRAEREVILAPLLRNKLYC